MTPDIHIREAVDADKDELISLIGGCFDEYEGCVLDMEEMPELLGIATAFREANGRFWVAEIDGRVVGSIGFTPGKREGYAELRKLYVRKEARRFGVGNTLCTLAEEESKRAGYRGMEMWSDTRFQTAHRFYQKRGYEKGPTTRFLHDKSNTEEHYFHRLF
ncbi:MAG: GNAT family N-acetyltransferase [Polyangiaceae bacterium]